MKVRISLVIAALAGTAVATLAACATESASTAGNSLTLTVSDADAEVFEQVDLGTRGFGPGDMLIEDAPIVDESGATIGGTLTTITVVNGADMADFDGLIDCTVELADGTMHFAGGFAMADMGTGATVPVVGGTGAYQGASGVVMMTMPDETKSVLEFDYTLP